MNGSRTGSRWDSFLRALRLRRRSGGRHRVGRSAGSAPAVPVRPLTPAIASTTPATAAPEPIPAPAPLRPAEREKLPQPDRRPPAPGDEQVGLVFADGTEVRLEPGDPALASFVSVTSRLLGR